MKKLLFTFATLFVALSAAATVHPLLGFCQNGNQVSEIEVVPGGDRVEVTINLIADGYDAMQGVQLQWVVYNPEHQPVGTVTFANFGSNSRPKYFQPGEIHEEYEWSTSASYLNEGSVLRLLSKNDDGYPLLEGGEYNEFGSDASIWKIGFVAAADWADEYVTIELDPAGFQNVWSLPGSGSIDHEQTMVLKIKNANYVPPVVNKDFQGDVTVTVDQATGAVTAVYNPAEGEDVEPTVVVEPSQLTDYGVQNVTVTVSADGYNTKTYTKEVNWVKPNADFQGTVTVSVDENGNITAVYNAADGEDVNPTVTVTPNKMDDYGTVDVVVTVEAEGYNTKTYNETATWTKPAPKELTGTLTISDHVDGHFTVTYSGDEDVVINCTITKQGAKESTQGYDLPGYGTYDVYAIATATDPAYEGDFVEANKVLTWEAPQPKEFQGTVEVTVDENGNITAAYVPADDEVVPEDMTITWDPTKVTESGTYTVNYTVKAEGYNDKTGSAQVTYTKPEPQTEPTVAPSTQKNNEIIWDAPHVCHNEYHITLVNNDEDDAVIYYRIGVGTLNEETGEWSYDYPDEYLVYTGEIIVTTPGTYMIDAYAIAPNKTESSHTYDGFTVASTTSIEEMFADKTLAGVRYFNLAGQEMQEANGICISVYTFTDGTQVAVKVMQ